MKLAAILEAAGRIWPLRGQIQPYAPIQQQSARSGPSVAGHQFPDIGLVPPAREPRTR